MSSTAWWHEIQDLTDTPLGDLIDGLDEIAAQAIPYGHLPGRARSFYAAKLSTWSDLAGETLSSLIDRPQGGVSTVRAIVVAAREAVTIARSAPADDRVSAATGAHRLLERLTDRDRDLLSARGWALQPQTIPETARRLGVAPVNVQRNQPRAYARFLELLAEPAHRAVIDHAAQLRQRLGPLTRAHTVELALKDLGLELATDAGQLLVHIAGPYARRDTWLQNTSTDGLDSASAILDAAFDHWGAPTAAALIHNLNHIGIPVDTAKDFIESRPGLRRFGDRWVKWGTLIADKAEAALHLSGVPASADLIAATVGDNHHPRAVREALYSDPRFTRATKQTWALRNWGLDEYLGVFAEIAGRIDRAGGTIRVKVLLDDMKSAFPDIAESSIRTYLSKPGFVVDDGMVRRRTDADRWPATRPLHTIRGVFHKGRNEIRIALPVTRDLLRGSGQTLHPAVATALGVHPGRQRIFNGTLADITLAWRLSSTKGPTVGSLRALAADLGANPGDTLVLVFNVRDASINAARISSAADPRQRLRVLLGKRVRDPITALAGSLRTQPEEVSELLRRRGDNELLEFVAQPAT